MDKTVQQESEVSSKEAKKNKSGTCEGKVSRYACTSY